MEKAVDVPQWLLTHFIDEKALNAAKNDDFQSFVEARGAMLMQAINDRCRVTSQADFIMNDDDSLFDDVENDDIDDKIKIDHV